MKKIILITFILISTLIYSQQIYPLNTTEARINYPSGSYFKDLDGELDPYIGLWKGTWEGKTLFIQFKKLKYMIGKTSDPHYIYIDRILGERKVIEANGTVSIDRISSFDNQNAQFDGIDEKLTNPSQKQIYFVTGICGITANLDVTFLDTAKTQMSLHFIYNPGYLDESCPYYNSMQQGTEPPLNFPKDIVLTKQ
ncbi:hypothetical protein LPB90_20190 [Chryseobacterium sp. LC2016-29]|uniref:DUF6705 family protein n=1 Tax=Chryseobacterium sp. LC2016-29 TaxID=2897331 RepID=UPI001E2D1AB3|nr:DUF6705 family protein [Chryseobacterium sp. LC2016-29]MCD0480770.1 hypothetical protein [Chryseobacterium sp. LC2016-29]